MNGIQIVAEARVGNDPELREVSGTAVCNLSLAVTERKQNKQTQQWEDAGTTWLRAAIWGPMAHNVAQSIMKGQLVNVTGTLSERKYTTSEGAERAQLEVRVDAISPSLRFATAQVTPNDRGGNGNGGAPLGQQPTAQQWQPGQAPQQAPWQTPQPPQRVQQPVPAGAPGPQQGQQWATPSYQDTADLPF